MIRHGPVSRVMVVEVGEAQWVIARAVGAGSAMINVESSIYRTKECQHSGMTSRSFAVGATRSSIHKAGETAS